MYVYNGSTSYWGVIRNNNTVIDPNFSATAYPLYISTAAYITNWDIDYNNWYSKNYLGYVGSAISTLADFQTAVSTALHESNESIVFADTTDLHMRSYVNLRMHMEKFAPPLLETGQAE